MKNLLIPMNLQLFSDEEFVSNLSSVLGVSAETKEVAEPSSTEIVTGTDEKKATEVKKEKEEPKRDIEKDSAFASQRREKEAIEKKLTNLEEQRAKDQSEQDEWYKNEYGSHGITSEAEYRQAVQKQKEEALKEKATEGDQEAIDELLKSNTDKVTAEVKKDAIERARLEVLVETQLLELNEEYGLSFKTLEDFKASPNGSIAFALMGTTTEDGSFISAKKAYEMVNYETLISSAKEKTKQEVLNKANGFNHTKVDSKPSGDSSNITLSAETLAFYDQMGLVPDENHLKRVMRS